MRHSQWSVSGSGFAGEGTELVHVMGLAHVGGVGVPTRDRDQARFVEESGDLVGVRRVMGFEDASFH